MMDGQVAAVRDALDAAGHPDTPILGYAAKYASAFYGPFREAVQSSLVGDRRTYQLDPANRREGEREVLLDVDEGADVVMVKPAMSYLDVLADAAASSPVPVWAYQVSGEFAMIEAAAANGWIDRERAILESVTSIRRAGADAVLTYFAVELPLTGHASLTEVLEVSESAGFVPFEPFESLRDRLRRPTRKRSSPPAASCRAASTRPCARSARSAAPRARTSPAAARTSPTSRDASTSTSSGSGGLRSSDTRTPP